jgi:hypothetical protein
VILSLKKLKPFLWSDLKVTSVSCHKRVTATQQDIFMSEEECVRACDQDCRVTSFLKKKRLFKRHPGHDPWDTILLKQGDENKPPMCVLFSFSVIFVNLIKAFIYKKALFHS